MCSPCAHPHPHPVFTPPHTPCAQGEAAACAVWPRPVLTVPPAFAPKPHPGLYGAISTPASSLSLPILAAASSVACLLLIHTISLTPPHPTFTPPHAFLHFTPPHSHLVIHTVDRSHSPLKEQMLIGCTCATQHACITLHTGWTRCNTIRSLKDPNRSQWIPIYPNRRV